MQKNFFRLISLLLVFILSLSLPVSAFDEGVAVNGVSLYEAAPEEWLPEAEIVEEVQLQEEVIEEALLQEAVIEEEPFQEEIIEEALFIEEARSVLFENGRWSAELGDITVLTPGGASTWAYEDGFIRLDNRVQSRTITLDLFLKTTLT